MEEISLNYADIKKVDVANGPGVRVSLFVSGCTHRCEECFNPETWDFDYGTPFGEAEIEKILALLAPDHIRGLSLLGGEPFEPANQEAVLELVRRVREELPQKTIWCYSGYLFHRRAGGRPLRLGAEGPGTAVPGLLQSADHRRARLPQGRDGDTQ